MSTEEQLSEIKGVESLKQFYETNKQNINIAAIAAILLLAGVWYYYKQYKPSLEIEASDSLFMAERYYGEDSLNLALNGDGINLGMIDIADEYGSTKVGERATYFAGRILLEQGKYNESLEYLEDASFDDEFLAAQIIALQGDCYSELGEYEKAGDYYMKAANKRSN
ncbi:MAG: tetratricopeptide repeat protein, partial [Bacteroidia bacterium]|nr:tetratricopeptide repeat protein [Bacteroidia bacterium]